MTPCQVGQLQANSLLHTSSTHCDMPQRKPLGSGCKDSEANAEAFMCAETYAEYSWPGVPCRCLPCLLAMVFRLLEHPNHLRVWPWSRAGDAQHCPYHFCWGPCATLCSRAVSLSFSNLTSCISKHDHWPAEDPPKSMPWCAVFAAIVSQTAKHGTPNHDSFLSAKAWCLQVFVGGSETTTEHRAQIYTPSYLQNGKPRPAITSSPSNVGYSANFSIRFSGVPSLDRIVFNRLAGATHSNHFDQRQVVLDCSDTNNTANCRSPPNSSVAPPGLYQLFVLFQGVPSRANIVNVTVVDTPPPVDGNRGSGLPQTGPARTPGSPVTNLVASSVAVGG